MLYKNQVPVNKENFPVDWEHYQTKIAENKKLLPKRVRFLRRVTVTLDPGELIPVFTIPCTATVNGTDGFEQWIWSKSPLRTKDGILVWANSVDNRIMMQDNVLTLDRDKDAELIYFLTEKEGLFKNGKYVLEDKKAAAKKRTAEEQEREEVRFLLFNKNSPLCADADVDGKSLRTICAAWGIQKAFDYEEYSHEELLLKLFDLVNNSELNRSQTGRGFAEFIRDADLGPTVIKRGLLQNAVDKSVIFYEPFNKQWKWVDSQVVICDVPDFALNNTFNHLCNTKLNDEKFMKSIEAIFNELPPLTPKQIDAMDFNTLRSTCYKYSIRAFGMKIDDMKSALMKVAVG